MANFNSAAFERHSYTPGLLEGSSPRSVSSIPSAAASGPVLTGMRRSTSRSKLFMQTLTHPSSWVLPNQLTVQVVHGASPSSTGALEDEVATSARARPEGPSTSRFPATAFPRFSQHHWLVHLLNWALIQTRICNISFLPIFRIQFIAAWLWTKKL